MPFARPTPEHKGNTITIKSSAAGLATIWDKDILLFTISCLVEAQNRGLAIGRSVRLRARDLPEMYASRRWLFDELPKLAGTLPKDIGIPADRLVELGVEVKL